MRNALEFKYYDNHNEDLSPHDPDPRPLEDLKSVINPGFDEDGTILSHPAPPHIPRLNQLDRMIFESGAISGNKVLWPHLDTSGAQRHLTVSYIKNRAQCTEREADWLVQSCVSLDATKPMVDVFCDGARKNGAIKVIQYLWKYVLAVTEAEAPSDEVEPWESEPVTAGELIGGLFGQAGLCEDVPVEEIERPVKEGPMATVVNGKLTWVEDIQALTVKEVPEVPEPEPSEMAGVISYHVLEDFGRVEEPWIDSQPKWYKQLLEEVNGCKTLAELAQFGKAVYGKKDLNRNQAGVFWTEYNSHKHSLEPKMVTTTAQGILKRIITANDVTKLASWLYAISKGKVNIDPLPTKHEMSIIWQTYKRRKEVQATA